MKMDFDVCFDKDRTVIDTGLLCWLVVVCGCSSGLYLFEQRRSDEWKAAAERGHKSVLFKARVWRYKFGRRVHSKRSSKKKSE